MKIKKRVLSFVTALATVGSMLTCVPVMNEQLGYDTSTVSASEAGSANVGTGGSMSSGCTTPTSGATTGGTRMGLLVYPILLPDDSRVIEPLDFAGLNRWELAAQYGTYLLIDAGGTLCGTTAAESLKTISLYTARRTLKMNADKGYMSGGNAFDDAIRSALKNSGFCGGDFEDISASLNKVINDMEDNAFFNAWLQKVGITDNSEIHIAIENAIKSDRFLWGVEILGEIENGGVHFMMPLSDMCDYRADEINTGLTTGLINESYKSMNIAKAIVVDKGRSFGAGAGTPSDAFTWYLNKKDRTSYGALGCLRPNTNNGRWNGKGDGFGGWGIITVDADDLDLGTTNIQFIETATLIAGNATSWNGVDRDELINYNEEVANTLEKNEYAQNGVVANFINRVSSVWELRNGRRYVMTYTDEDIADTTATGAYPWSMLATSPIAGTEFKLNQESIVYKAVLSDGSLETTWFVLDDLGNKKLGINTNDEELVVITEGNYKGKSIQSVARELDQDIFFIASAVYTYGGLGDGNFKGVKIPENKLIQRSESLLDYINRSSGYWKFNSVGSLYGQYSDVGIPKFNVGDNNFFAATDGLNNIGTKSSEKNVNFIASTWDTDTGDKDTNILEYYAGTAGVVGYKQSVSALRGFISPTGVSYSNSNTTEMIDCGTLKDGYDIPSYNDKETTRYRFNETGTDGKTLVARNGLGDNINVAGFSKFTFDDGSKAFVAAYDYLEGNIPASRKVPDNNGYNNASGDMGFVRATSNYASNVDQNLKFNKASLTEIQDGLLKADKNAQLVTEQGCYLGVSNTDANKHFSSVTITGKYKKASVDTKLKANATGYIDRGSSWSDSTNSITDKGFTTTSSSSFKFYPEVEMQYDTFTDTDKSIYVVGDGIKEVKPLIYSTFGIDTGSTKIDSTAIAVDKRAKALAKKIATDETPVYLPGGILSGTTQDMKLTINSYVLDLDVATATNNAWGNTAYNPANDVKAAIEDKVSKVGITQKLVVKDKDTEKGTFGISDGSEEVEVKEIGTPTKRKDYYFFVQDGDITLKGISTFTGEAGSLSETKISNDEGLSDELDDFNKIVEQLKVQDVIDTVLAQNKGTGAWYTEDTSILKISMYETAVSLPGIAFSDKLPLDAGPETADKKDDQYNKGYKAYITAGIKIKDASGKTYELGSSEATGDPSFVIPNVTVVDVAQ